jgi:hypothetical protein
MRPFGYLKGFLAGVGVTLAVGCSLDYDAPKFFNETAKVFRQPA